MLFLLQRVGKSVSLSEPVRVPCNLFGAERGKRKFFSFFIYFFFFFFSFFFFFLLFFIFNLISIRSVSLILISYDVMIYVS